MLVGVTTHRIDDVLGNVLEGSRLRGHVFCQSVARAPWGLRMAARPEAMFHLLTKGSAHLIVNGRAHPLAQGDLALLPRGAAHVLADQPRSKPIDLAAWIGGGLPDDGMMRLGSRDGVETRVLCGVYRFDGLGAHHPVLRLLPEYLVLPAARSRADGELAATLTALAREQERNSRGASVIVSRLLEVLFVQIVRAWAADQPSGGAGWIGALDDELVARALSAIHADLRREWNVVSLARAAATSRATLGRRFVAGVGEPPLAYLARARMQEAAQLLLASDAGLGAIAEQVGYQSEFAFNRAFRRAFGIPPGAYRRARRAS